MQWIRKIGASLDLPGGTWLQSLWSRYLAAVALALAAQLARVPLHPPTILPFVTYTPFLVTAALFGGLGPGLLATLLCTLETLYFAIEPLGSIRIVDSTQWHGVAAFSCTGVLASLLAERLKRIGVQLAANHRRTTAILESISDGFSTFDEQWRYTYVNAAAARMLGRAPEELLGRNLWELWPHAGESGEALHRAAVERVPVRVEAYYPEPLSAWFEVRCYPSTEGVGDLYEHE